MTFSLTDAHIESAREMGARHASNEKLLGRDAPREPIEDDEDVRDIAWRVTGQKLDSDSDDAEVLAGAYAEGYWEEWT